MLEKLKKSYKSFCQKADHFQTRIVSFLICKKNTNKQESGIIVTLIVIAASALAIGLLVNWSKETLNVVSGILGGVAWILWIITQELCNLAVKIFDSIYSMTIKSPITTDPSFVRGWATVRDLANMLIVLGFVFVAIATALRIKQYEAGNFLAKLIIVALLLNFSNVFVGVMIDTSNIAMTSFFTGGSPTGGNYGEYYYNGINNSLTKIDDKSCDKSNNEQSCGVQFLARSSAGAFTYLLVAITFFYLAFIFAARYVILALLFVLSPLAFVMFAFPFPKAKGLWDQWWEHLFKWAFIGMGAAFCLWLSSMMLQAYTNAGAITLEKTAVVLLFLVIGFKMIAKSSALGAGAVMGIAAGVLTGGAGFALGAASKLGKSTMERLSRSESGPNAWINDRIQSAKSRSMRLAERMGFAKEGGAASMENKTAQDARATIERLRTSRDAGDRARYEGYVRNGRGAKGAAAVAIANDEGDLGRILNPNNNAAGLNRMNQRVTDATAFGYERSAFEKKNYQLRHLNINAVDQALTAAGVPTVGATAAARVASATAAQRADAERTIDMSQLRSALPQMSTAELGRINPGHVGGGANYNFVRENFKPNTIEQLQLAPPVLKAAMRTHLGVIGTPGTLADDINNAIIAGNNGEATRLQRLYDAIDMYC